MPTKTEIIQALKVLRTALANRFGDEASGASMGDGFNIDVRCSGIDLIGEGAVILIQDGEPEAIADELLKQE